MWAGSARIVTSGACDEMMPNVHSDTQPRLEDDNSGVGYHHPSRTQPAAMSPPITTKPATSYMARAAFMAVICIVFGVWGAYDLWVKIPAREELVRRYEEAGSTLKRLDDARADGHTPTQAEIDEYNRAKDELRRLMPDGKAPPAPGEWDRTTQWIFIACLPVAVWPIMQLVRARAQKYTLDESGTLHFAGDAKLDSGAWPANEIADIDMSRWMRKSVANVVHTDGRRLGLDAYVHKDLELIVGSLASRLHPQKWTADAKPIKPLPAEPAPPGASGDPGRA
jgi:hypothetical protein